VFTICYGFFFLIVGLILLGIGVWVEGVRKDYESINDVLHSPSIMAIIVGIVMIIISLIGLIGALKEHLLLLRIFLGVIIIVFILQVVIGVLAFVYKEETLDVVNAQLKGAIRKYHEHDDVQHAIDSIQRKFECCGLRNANQWDFNELYSCNSDNDTYACSVPSSCCKNEKIEDCGMGVRSNTTSVSERVRRIHFNGCTMKFYEWIEDKLDVVGATALGFAILHIVAIFLVYLFICKVEDRIYLFKYRERAYQA